MLQQLRYCVCFIQPYYKLIDTNMNASIEDHNPTVPIEIKMSSILCDYQLLKRAHSRANQTNTIQGPPSITHQLLSVLTMFSTSSEDRFSGLTLAGSYILENLTA